ncbi:pyrroloquinoline quinone biosynthesis protein PqqD [Rhodomicrobium udaipurense JA643]|uniref:Pyrroloquinoline quinone biosynthesis peptide chaperone PqqD n=2 Tax=Rhodomicrobium udaipurense TaxID=1202716 RepID=A0A8I1KJ44_9HYPH|nr:pyrroloquinoline quinone biosynthesis peptide chaperone PqqD [Rhodomicrobium udaipurense]KAI96298.1 pyrroloquinoline quinone biosynthesis protein PqqD [Rhodomicrobium udaipurense JA643]MBJ7542439.1 pyrroloquinoline quinone biosynthesis peptide chaperone PqqD [Rhodomicrobium udaipurense]
MICELRERAVVSARSAPKMPRHVRLRFDPVRGRHAVLAPERVYWPDDIAVDILKLCDGERTIAAMSATLAAEYAAPVETIEADVLEFIQGWMDLRLLTL